MGQAWRAAAGTPDRSGGRASRGEVCRVGVKTPAPSEQPLSPAANQIPRDPAKGRESRRARFSDCRAAPERHGTGDAPSPSPCRAGVFTRAVCLPHAESGRRAPPLTHPRPAEAAGSPAGHEHFCRGRGQSPCHPCPERPRRGGTPLSELAWTTPLHAHHGNRRGLTLPRTSRGRKFHFYLWGPAQNS